MESIRTGDEWMTVGECFLRSIDWDEVLGIGIAANSGIRRGPPGGASGREARLRVYTYIGAPRPVALPAAHVLPTWATCASRGPMFYQHCGRGGRVYVYRRVSRPVALPGGARVSNIR